MLHVNEFLADEAGRIAVFFPTGKDDVAQALGIGVLHAFLPGVEAQVVPRSLGGAGAGASVRHGQDAVPDAGRVDERGIFCRVDFQAVARIEVQGAVLRDGQAVTGFDAADVPGRGRAVVACVLGAPGPVFGLGGFGRRAVGAVRRVCRAPGRPRGTVARSPGGGSRRVARGLDVCHHLFRALLAGGRHDHRAGELFQQLLALGRGLIQAILHDLGVKARAADQIDILAEGHVAHDGQLPAHGQRRTLVQITERAAGVGQRGGPARGPAGFALGRGQADHQLGFVPDPEGKGKLRGRAVAFKKRAACAVGHGHN